MVEQLFKPFDFDTILEWYIVKSQYLNIQQDYSHYHASSPKRKIQNNA